MKNEYGDAVEQTYKRKPHLRGKKGGRPKSKVTRYTYFERTWEDSFNFFLDLLEKDETEYQSEVYTKYHIRDKSLYKIGFRDGKTLAKHAFVFFVYEALGNDLQLTKEIKTYLKAIEFGDEWVRGWAKKELKRYPNDIVRKLRRSKISKRQCIHLQRTIDEYEGILTYQKASELLKISLPELELLILECRRQKVQIKAAVQKGEKVFVAR
jgi:hypothetical protein